MNTNNMKMIEYKKENEIENVNINQIMQSLSQMTQLIGQTIQVQINTGNQIGIIANDVDSLKNDMGDMKSKIYSLENSEEIKEDMIKHIMTIKNRRIREMLPTTKEYSKYSRRFHAMYFFDMRKFHHMAMTYRRTQKRYYQEILDATEAWIPSCGILELKRRIDEEYREKYLI